MVPPRPSAIRLSSFAVSWAGAVALLAAGVSPLGAAGAGESWERGKAFYTERCLFCHGEDGRGWSLETRIPRPPVPVPDLTDPAFMGGFTDQELFGVIKEGGTRMGKSRFMPPAGLWLSDADIRDLIVYVRNLERGRAGAQR